MNATNRAIPASDYIDAVRRADVIVEPWPCKNCQHATFCKDNISQCEAWRQYDSVGRKSGEWNPDDRVPDKLQLESKLSLVANKFVTYKGCVRHNGYQFKPGSLTETIYLIIKEKQVASNRDIANELDRRGIIYAMGSLKAITQSMHTKKQLVKLHGVGWSWGAEAKS